MMGAGGGRKSKIPRAHAVATVCPQTQSPAESEQHKLRSPRAGAAFPAKRKNNQSFFVSPPAQADMGERHIRESSERNVKLESENREKWERIERRWIEESKQDFPPC